jgi:hypothetical protein
MFPYKYLMIGFNFLSALWTVIYIGITVMPYSMAFVANGFPNHSTAFIYSFGYIKSTKETYSTKGGE